MFEDAICIPCRMPYITSMFMPRTATDRPLPVPKSVNLAFVSQFVEIPDDVVFTVEYSVRAAQMAVYRADEDRSPRAAGDAARQIACGDLRDAGKGVHVTGGAT